MDIKQAAKLLSSRGASKGGIARAASLSSQAKKLIATNAAKARWNSKEEIADNPSPDCDDPRCPCHSFRKNRRKDPMEQCVLNKPLMMVIPPEGVHLTCPIHGKHFIPGNRVTFCA